MLCLLVVLSAGTAGAREGFSIHLGIGGGFFDLGSSSLGSALEESGVSRSDGTLLTGTLSDGLALRLSASYTIRGIVSIEAGITGHGWNLGQDDLGGSGHVSGVAHFHPLCFFFPDRPYDATVFLGGGYSIVGGGQPNDDNSRGLDGGTLEFGLTGRYFFTPWFSLGGELRFSVPFFDRWFVDWGDDIEFDLKSHPKAFFTALMVSFGFHFSPAK